MKTDETHNLPIFRDNVVCPKCNKRTPVQICPEANEKSYFCHSCYRRSEWKPSKEYLEQGGES
jgi:transposase-like protein